ncbi:MAG: SprT family zinc-dependent metalloprotease [Rhodospirillales bacterium]
MARRPANTVESLTVEGREVPLRFRVNKRARRLILRVDDDLDGAVVTLPPYVARAEARRFAEERADWIARRLEKQVPRTLFEDGVAIPVLGVERTIRHTGGTRRPVVCTDDELLVAGAVEHLPRRVADWLKAEARRQIEPRALEMADTIGERCRRITIRDTRSRWGSCAHDGGLNFSWRLVLAPLWVLEYVVAHEVAHLAEHNHSTRFWAVVDRLNGDAERGRAWLGVHGPALHRYG